MEPLTICLSHDLHNVGHHLQYLQNVRVVTAMSDNVDYYFGVDYAGTALPRHGMIIRGNELNRATHQFVLEDRLFMDEHGQKVPYFFFRRKGMEPIYPNVSFVIQGIDVKECIVLSAIAFLFGHIVISTWQKYKFEDIKTKVAKGNLHNVQNIYYQVHTSNEGLQKVKTEWAIKVRSDEIYIGFDDFIKNMFDNPDKIVCTNLFLRRAEVFAYHFSDHVIGGKTKELLAMFGMAQHLIDAGIVQKKPFPKCRWVPEQVLTVGYLLTKYYWHELQEYKCPKIMKLHFVSMDIRDFKHFQITYSVRPWMSKGPWTKAVVTPQTLYQHEKKIIDLQSIDCL